MLCNPSQPQICCEAKAGFCQIHPSTMYEDYTLLPHPEKLLLSRWESQAPHVFIPAPGKQRQEGHSTEQSQTDPTLARGKVKTHHFDLNMSTVVCACTHSHTFTENLQLSVSLSSENRVSSMLSTHPTTVHPLPIV